MDSAVITEVLKQSIITIILISSPVLLISMIVGLIVSIFQATTSIQDQTLTFVPKIIAIFATLIIFGPWMGDTMIDRTTWILGLIAEVK
ncbi:MAG: flagellar biosynthesis protein FliQ [Spirochaetales bacterium]|nr:flagellar biosynthesis protein FliQ [Spirochaetales bacterium]